MTNGASRMFSHPATVDGTSRGPYVWRARQKERFMRPITGLIVAALAVLALAGCSTTASDNTTYARPADSGGGMRIAIN